MSASLKIGILIVTYNGEPWLEQCLAALKSYGDSCPIIVIDNHSDDNTVEILESWKDELSFMRVEYLNSNIGFGAANNLGMSLMTQFEGLSHVFLLNQDAYLMNDTLDELHKLIEPDRNTVYALLQLKTNVTLDRIVLNHYVDHGNCPGFIEDAFFNRLKATYQIRFSNAAAWVIPLKTWQLVGAFSPLFFHYGEDANFIHRCGFHGVDLLLCPSARVIHDRPECRKNNAYFNNSIELQRALTLKYANPSNRNNLLHFFMECSAKYLLRLLRKKIGIVEMTVGIWRSIRLWPTIRRERNNSRNRGYQVQNLQKFVAS